MNAAVILLALWFDFIVIPGAIAGTIYGVVRAAGAGKRNRRARVAAMNAQAAALWYHPDAVRDYLAR